MSTRRASYRWKSSARARRARQHLLRALSETDGLVVGVGNAWDVLDLPLEHHHHAGLALSATPVRPVQECGRSVLRPLS
ncbi:MAG: hypothetical protein ACRDRP_16975 [Pseudonocardiaceae bacterium]